VKLKPLQLFWMAGTVAFFLAVLLDIADVIQFPNTLMLASALVLTTISMIVGPSLSEMKKQNRRG
jgi:hypothetical protein